MSPALKQKRRLPAWTALLLSLSQATTPLCCCFLTVSPNTQPVILHSTVIKLVFSAARQVKNRRPKSRKLEDLQVNQLMQSFGFCSTVYFLSQRPTWRFLKLYRLDKMTPNFTCPTRNKEMQVEDPAVCSGGEIQT